jgi:hypothetical protein
MASTLTVHYTNMVNSAIYIGDRISRVFDYLGSHVTINPDTGSVTMPFSTAFTATAISDGTLTTGLQANTNSALTISEYQCTISILPQQVSNFITQPSNMQVYADQAADALKKAVTDLYLTAWMAGTPTYSYDLTAGKAHFAAAGATELQIWLKALLGVSATRGGDTSQWRCLMPPLEYANFAGTVAATWPNFGFVDAGGMYVVHGCPTIPIPHASATNWGAVSNSAAAFVHPDGAPCKIGPVKNHGGLGLHAADDGTFKLILTNVAAYLATLQVALSGEVKNGAS